ncbi:MAG: lipopolysaccharide biosynthesis [Tardiphaga sp.]|nr:lipopolysaccharide biosynthesis [Tardiphaga sp.]
MRFAFWRRGKDETVQDAAKPSIKGSLMESLKAVKMPSTAPRAPVVKPEPKASVAGVARQPQPADAGDLDLRAIWQTLLRKKHFILIPTACAMVLALIAVNMISPRYKSEARILIDGRENIFLRPNGERTEERTALDAEAVTSQVQLLLSRDLAREVIKKNKLAERPEFDPVLQGTSPIKAMLALFGIGRDPFQLTPEERVLDAYFDRLTAFAVDKSRVVVIEFQSRDPELAAKVANSIADGYLTLQQSARQDQAKSAGQWLSVEIDSLRKKVAEAEGRADDFRSKANLFIGSNNTSLSSQQLSEINTQLNAARAQKSDAETKARLIREMLNTGKPIEASEVMNSELTRRLSEQRVTLRAQLAEQSSTLLDRHPRILELKAQLSDLDRQLRDEAGKLSRSFEYDAKIAGA